MRIVGLTGVCRAGDLKEIPLSQTTKKITLTEKLANGLEIQVIKNK